MDGTAAVGRHGDRRGGGGGRYSITPSAQMGEGWAVAAACRGSGAGRSSPPGAVPPPAPVAPTPAVATPPPAEPEPASKAEAATEPELAEAEPEPAAAVEDEDEGIEPNIDTELCTTYNECTNLNPKMFKHDDNNQAYIVDPRAGHLPAASDHGGALHRVDHPSRHAARSRRAGPGEVDEAGRAVQLEPAAYSCRKSPPSSVGHNATFGEQPISLPAAAKYRNAFVPFQ